MSGFFIAAMVITLLQYLRVKERRMLPLLTLFALLALGHFRGEGDCWGRAFFIGAVLSGLWMLWSLSPRHPHPAPRREDDSVARGGA